MSEMQAKGWNAEEVRKDLPPLSRPLEGKRLVYLDSACTALKPRPVVEAAARFEVESAGCGGKRSSHKPSQEVQRRADDARLRVARFLNAESPNEIVFAGSTTDAMNLLARALRPAEGRDEVVVTDLAHNSAFLPFLERSREGAFRLKVLETEDGRLAPERFDAALSGRTALAVLSSASNVFGGFQPLAGLVRAAHRKGVKVAADAAQYVATHREDVRASDVDFLAFSAHKLGGPFGVGVLYGKEQALNGLGNGRVGGGTVRDVAPSRGGWEAAYLDAPQRFEAGVQNVPGWVGLAEAIDYWEGLGLDALRSHVSGLVLRAHDGLRETPGLRILGSRERLAEGALVSFVPEAPDFPMHDFNLFLNHELPEHIVALRIGDHCAHVLHKTLGVRSSVRMSFHGCNTEADADAAVEAVRRFMRVLAQ